MRRVLVIAYYFPPMGLSGVQRTAKFVKYLPDFGWQPTVLTVEPGGYFAYDEALLAEVRKAGIPIHRTASLDPTRLFGGQAVVKLPEESKRQVLSTLSQYLFIPDNKIGWMPFALQEGRRLLEKQPFDLVFSSAPPYTGHLIARRLSKQFNLPLVTDFRDDWVGNPRHVYPTPLHRWLHQRLEHSVLRASSQVLTINGPICNALVARNTREHFKPRVSVLPQGFDANDFADTVPIEGEGRLRLVYSGVFYDAQTPDYFLKALARVVEQEPELRSMVEAVFVGLVPEPSRALAQTLGIEELIRYVGYVSHASAVRHVLGADVLWMTIGKRPGAECISTSKLFEYFGARKPILALVPEGAARQVLAAHGASYVVEPDDIEAIAKALKRIVNAWKQGQLLAPDETYVAQFDRKTLAGRLAEVFMSCCLQ